MSRKHGSDPRVNLGHFGCRSLVRHDARRSCGVTCIAIYLTGSNQQNESTLPAQNIVTIYRTTTLVDGLPAEPNVWFQTSYPGNSGYLHGLEHIAFLPAASECHMEYIVGVEDTGGGDDMHVGMPE